MNGRQRTVAYKDKQIINDLNYDGCSTVSSLPVGDLNSLIIFAQNLGVSCLLVIVTFYT